MKRHQFMVEVAKANDDHALVKDSYGHLLNLSRRSVHAGTNHLFNYTRSIIENVAHCDEPKQIYKLQNELTSTLHRAKTEEGRNLDFAYSALEGVIHAQLQSAKGDVTTFKNLELSGMFIQYYVLILCGIASLIFLGVIGYTCVADPNERVIHDEEPAEFEMGGMK